MNKKAPPVWDIVWCKIGFLPPKICFQKGKILNTHRYNPKLKGWEGQADHIICLTSLCNTHVSYTSWNYFMKCCSTIFSASDDQQFISLWIKFVSHDFQKSLFFWNPKYSRLPTFLAVKCNSMLGYIRSCDEQIWCNHFFPMLFPWHIRRILASWVHLHGGIYSKFQTLIPTPMLTQCSPNWSLGYWVSVQILSQIIWAWNFSTCVKSTLCYL